MKYLTLGLIVAILSGMHAISSEPNIHGDFGGAAKEGIGHNKLIDDCDLLIDWVEDDRFDLGIGTYNNDGSYIPNLFSWMEITGFLKKYKHKDLIVIRVNPRPSNFTDKQISDLAGNVHKFGFKRVVFVRLMALSNIVLLDSSIEPNAPTNGIGHANPQKN